MTETAIETNLKIYLYSDPVFKRKNRLVSEFSESYNKPMMKLKKS